MVRDKDRCQVEDTCALTPVNTVDKLLGWICGAVTLLMVGCYLGEDAAEHYFIVLLRVMIIISPIVTIGAIALIEMSSLPLWKKVIFITLGLVILFVTYRWSRQMTVEHLSEAILRHRFLPRS